MLRLGLGCAVLVAVTSWSGAALADYVINANRPIVVSDDITNRTTKVVSAGSGSGESAPPAGDELAEGDGPGNDDNRSGLGDYTNPGLGDGTDNSPNEGTLNPNRAPR